jgi:tetratricopeptide (TPR) repeat protein
MTSAAASWESRLADLWQSLPAREPARFRELIQELVAELPAGDAKGLFELACAQDSTGHSELAVPLYRAALEKGLSGVRRRRATIQMSSSLRNTGEFEEALSLLEAESLQPDDELSSAVAAFRALTLSSLGREREALGYALSALSRHLPRYSASLGRYAAELLPGAREEPAA